MAALYQQFLASPSSSLLADDASLHYVPTTTSIKGAAEIIKHLGSLAKQVRKTKEDVLNTVDGQINAAFEIDTGLEFLTGGGPYLSIVNLPRLDDNLICDRTVYLPVHHFVNLNPEGKINQIRLAWDQGALLKQVEAIGRSGVNWPIKDNREQLALITSCLKSAGAGSAAATQSQNELSLRNRGNSTNALRDPHASLHMQPTREELEEMANSSVTAPYAGTKLQQRGFADILGDDPAGEHYEDRNAMSPAKAGGGKNYQPMRIFDGQEDAPEEDETKERPASAYIKPNPNKYKHFDFADGSDPADAAYKAPEHKSRPKSTHNSQWSFEDFTTPQKIPQRPVRPNEARHWDTDRDALGEQTPVQIHQQSKGRRDAESHFELQDDGEQVPVNTRQNKKGSLQNENLGLYKNKLFDQDEQGDEPSRALGNITNLKGRGQTFGAHWEMTDESPAHQAPQRQPIPEARQKAVKMMDANWSSYDESPKQKENTRLSEQKQEQKINIAGDGMGGRKGSNRDWMFGGDDDEEQAPKPAPKGRGSNLSTKQRDFWDF